MKCSSCPAGETAPGVKTMMLERDVTVLVVRHVPAAICDTCGAAVLSADTTDRLHHLLDEAVALRADVVVRDYATADLVARAS